MNILLLADMQQLIDRHGAAAVAEVLMQILEREQLIGVARRLHLRNKLIVPHTVGQVDMKGRDN